MTPPVTRGAAAAVLTLAALLTGCGQGDQGDDAKPATVTPNPPARQADPSARPPGPAPSVTARYMDPAGVARAYLTASQTLTAADATAPPRRAEAYMTPGNPERGIGQLVYDVPPAGVTRQPTDIKVSPARASADRAVLQITYTPALTKDGKTIKTEPVVATYVVCDKQPDGTWLVSREDPNITPEGDE